MYDFIVKHVRFLWKKCIRMFSRKFYYKTFSPACLYLVCSFEKCYDCTLVKILFSCLFFYVYIFCFFRGKKVYKEEKANRKSFLFPVSIKINVEKVLRSQLMLLFSKPKYHGLKIRGIEIFYRPLDK